MGGGAGAIPIPAGSLLGLAAILFCIGLFGALTKRNLIVVLISIELMLNAANINLVTFSRMSPHPSISGQVFTLFTITVAAAEVAVGLALILAVFRLKLTTKVEDLNEHRE